MTMTCMGVEGTLSAAGLSSARRSRGTIATREAKPRSALDGFAHGVKEGPLDVLL